MQTRPLSISFGGHYTFYSKKRGVKQVKRYKEIIKKLGAVTLALAMTATMVPGQALAEESVPDGQQVQQDTQQETEQNAQQSGEEAVQSGDAQKSESDGEKTADAESTQTAEGDETDSQTGADADAAKDAAVPGTAAQNSISAEDATDGNVSDEGDQSSDGNTADDSSTDETTGKADVNKPVIESVELVQQGETLHEGDTVEVRVKAYDADSGIAEVRISMGESYETGYESVSLDVEYNEAEECYIGTYTLDHVGTGTVNITFLRVVDNYSNYVDATLMDENSNEYLYWFNTKNEQNTIEPESVTFPENGELLTREDYGKFALKLSEADPGEYSGIRVSVQGEGENSDTVYLYYDWENNDYRDSGLPYYLAEDTYTVTAVTYPCLGEDLQILVDDMDKYSFQYQKDPEAPQEDTEAPVITSISLDKNGENVRAGDTVTVTIKAEDNVGLDTTQGSVYFNAVSDLDNSTIWVDLTYSEEQQAFTGTLEITEDTYPCEWYLGGIYIYDTSSNNASSGELLYDAPYYVQVYSGNTFVNPVYDVTYQFMELSEYGYWTEAETKDYKLERRQTLNEAGIELPQIEAKYKDLVFEGWTTYEGAAVTGDEPILNSTYATVYAKYDKVYCNVVYSYLASDATVGTTLGNINREVSMPFGSTVGDLKEVIEGQELPEQYEGLNFTAWELENTDDESLITMNRYYYADAVYDKTPVICNFSYLDNNGQWLSGTEDRRLLAILDKDATYGDLQNWVEKYRPEGMSDKYQFEQWESTSMMGDADEPIGADLKVWWFNAKYEGKDAVVLTEYYYNTEGRGWSLGTDETFLMDEGSTFQDVLDTLNAQELPEMYEGLKFKEWNSYTSPDFAIVNGGHFTVSAQYENCLIRYMLDPICADIENQTEPLYDDTAEAVFCQVAEVGDTITLPGSFEGYDNVIYVGDLQAGDTYTVDGTYTFLGYTPEMEPGAEEPGTEPEEPGTTPEEPGTEPEEPGTTPEEPGTEPEEPGTTPEKPGTTPEKPPVEVPDDSVSTIVEMVQTTPEGQKVDVDMGEATVVPKEVLEAAQGRDVNVVLQMNGYTWTINGKDIAASNLQDINLEVTLNSNAIPSNTVKKLAGNNPVEQLSLTHNGDFGFRADLTINVGSDNAGKFGNLYYYDSDGRMVFMNAGTIREDGTVSLSFSHASDYVVVISDKQMSQANVPDDLQPVKDSGKDQTTDGNKTSGQGQNTGKGSVKTGDMSPVIPTVIVLILAAAVIAGVVVVKKRQK